MTRVYERPAPLRDVLEEHLEEGAFLYHHRRRCFDDGRYSWEQSADRERRLDAHLQALVLGGRFSAELLQEKLVLDKDGDPGETFVAGAVLPSLGLVQPMQLVADAISAEPPHVRALVDGLRYASSDGVVHWAFDFLRAEVPALRAAGVDILGWHWPIGAEERIAGAARDPDPRVKLAVAEAMDANGRPFDVNPLLGLLDAPEPQVTLRVARLLLASGDDFTLDWLRRRRTDAGGVLEGGIANLLAVAGELSDVPPMRATQKKAMTDDAPSVLLALGRSGSTAAVDELLAVVRSATPAAGKAFVAAWQALGTISGEHRPPQFDLEDDGPEPLRMYAEAWDAWWSTTREKMSPTLKHRCGRPLSPGALVHDLRRPGNTARDLTHLELRIRYRCPLPFQPGARYAIQAAQLSALDAWGADAESKHAPGATYFAGKKR